MVVRILAPIFFIACAAPSLRGQNPIVAEVHGERIRAAEVDQMLATQLTKLDVDYSQKRYDMRRQGLDALMFRKLVEHEAARLKVDPEAYLQREVESKLVKPDEPELRGFYLEVADVVAPLKFEEVKAKLSDYLMQQRRSEAILGLYARLKSQAGAVITLEPPKMLDKKLASHTL